MHAVLFCSWQVFVCHRKSRAACTFNIKKTNTSSFYPSHPSHPSYSLISCQRNYERFIPLPKDNTIFNPNIVSSLKEKTAKGLLWGGINNSLQQLLNLSFGIILGRILNPSDYGMVGMLTIFTMIAGTIQESGFTAALANRDKFRQEDYDAVFWFSFLMGLCMYTLLFFTAPLIAAFYRTPELTPLARYVFLGFVISSLSTAHNAWFFTNLKVKLKGLIQFFSLALSGIVGVTLALKGFSYWGIATQSLVYIASNTILFWIYSTWRPSFHFSIRPLKEMIGFSCKILITNLATIINNNILTVALGRFYSEQEVGLFNQANKWTSMGYSTVQGMIASIAQPVLHDVSNDQERQYRIFRKMLRFTAFVSFPSLFGLSLIADEFITITITEKWIESAKILQLLCIGGAFIPIHCLYSNLLISKGRSDIYMWNTIFMGICQLISALICYPYGLNVMIVSYVALIIVWTGIWHFFIQREIGLSFWSALKDILPFMFIAIFSMFLAGYAASYTNNIHLSIILKIIIAGGSYVLLMFISGSITFKETVNYLMRPFKKN